MLRKILGRTLKSLVNNSVRASITINFLEEQLRSSTKRICDFDSDINTVVSLTTYSNRIDTVHLVIESLSNQTFKANRVVLWLDESEFSLDTIPFKLKSQIKRGLEVKFCPNIYSYKKLIPQLEDSMHNNIITVDDDIIYPDDLIERFVTISRGNPKTVICNHAHKIKLGKDNTPLKYYQWEHETLDESRSELIMPVGVGGVFYPVGCFTNSVLNTESFLELAPTADDLWFKVHSLRNGFLAKRVSSLVPFHDRFIEIPNTQSIGLFNINLTNGANDKQFKKISERYKVSELFSSI